MNMLARSVLSLYTLDENPDDVSTANLLRQSLSLIAKFPAIVAYSFHELGMRIIADWVPNHCSVQHPFFQEALANTESPLRQWFYFKKGTNDYRCFLHFPELAKFNLNNPQARRYMIRNAQYWLSLGFDGFRIDHGVVHLPLNCGCRFYCWFY